MIDDLFDAFDHRAGAFGVEKIKTLSDIYIALCGLLTQNEEYAQVIAVLALNVLQRLEEFDHRQRTKFQMCVGCAK